MTIQAFVTATRLKLRFDTPQGQLPIEDLWDLPLTSTNPNKANLDALAIQLHGKLQTTSTVSFVNTPAKVDDTTQVKFDVVKHIIDTRMAENASAAQAAANKAKKQQLLQVLERKENAAIENLSADEIKNLINSLG